VIKSVTRMTLSKGPSNSHQLIKIKNLKGLQYFLQDAKSDLYLSVFLVFCCRSGHARREPRYPGPGCRAASFSGRGGWLEHNHRQLRGAGYVSFDVGGASPRRDTYPYSFFHQYNNLTGNPSSLYQKFYSRHTFATNSF